MLNREILDVFYTKVVPEAQKGKIDCYFMVNTAFNLVINNEEISKCDDLPYDGLLIPTLKITNKELFDDMLVEYVKKARNFYDSSDFSFLNDISVSDNEDLVSLKEEYLTKYIICLLFANASVSDFDNPIEFLRSRIAMFDNKILNHDGELNLGYVDSIGASVYLEEEVSPIQSETPYRIKGYLKFDDDYKLLLPEIYVGDSGNKYQLYGIQKNKNSSSDVDEKSYLKQIRNGFIAKVNGAPEHYFLAVMIFLSLCSDKEIELIPLLIERWNAKAIAMTDKAKKNPNVSLSNLENEQERIQNIRTDIFIRYFTKLSDSCNGLDFSAFPFETDAGMYVNVKPNFESRCIAFNEIFNLVGKFKYQKNNICK